MKVTQVKFLIQRDTFEYLLSAGLHVLLCIKVPVSLFDLHRSSYFVLFSFILSSCHKLQGQIVI